MSHRRAIARGGAAAWTPPQSANLVAAWVSGLSGNVAKLGSWAGQYETTYAATMVGDAQVNSNGLELDGSGDYAEAPVPQVDTPFAVSAWINSQTALFGIRQPLAHGDFGNAIAWQYWPNTRMAMAGSGGKLVSFGTLPTGWVHLVCVRQIPTMKTYLNGNLVASGTASAFTPTADQFLLGVHSNKVSYPWCGYLDCVYYWQGAALSSDDIADLYANDPYRRGNL